MTEETSVCDDCGSMVAIRWTPEHTRFHQAVGAALAISKPESPKHPPAIADHPLYESWVDTGKTLRAELSAVNANHASWVPHSYSPAGLPLCAACEQSENTHIHWHNCAESGCGTSPAEGEVDA